MVPRPSEHGPDSEDQVGVFGPGEDGDRLAEGIPVVDPPTQEIRDGSSIIWEFAERTTQSAPGPSLGTGPDECRPIGAKAGRWFEVS